MHNNSRFFLRTLSLHSVFFPLSPFHQLFSHSLTLFILFFFYLARASSTTLVPCKCPESEGKRTGVRLYTRTDVSFLGSQSKAVDFITSTHVRRRRNRDREVRVFRTGSVAIVIRGRHRGLDCPCFLYVRLKHERSDCLSDVTFSGIAPLS